MRLKETLYILSTPINVSRLYNKKFTFFNGVWISIKLKVTFYILQIDQQLNGNTIVSE